MKRYIFLLLLGLCVAGCKKYDIEPLVKDPAYIRVFNDLTPTLDVTHSQQVSPFLTFLMDPETDAAGAPAHAAVTGDFLGTRQLFSLSYAANEANSSVGNTTTVSNGPGQVNTTPVNYEYPGNTPVLTAPVINGFDLSAWAQVPSGKHRIVIVIRPQNGIGFNDLSATIRSNILVDTTLDFEKGEVYTMEVVSRDLDNGKYGLYVRKEQFIHQAFDADKLYVGFINLSGKVTAEVTHGFKTVFPDRIKITGSYQLYNDAASANGGGNVFYNAVTGYDETYFTTLTTTMDTAVYWHPLPMLDQSAFFYQGLLRQYVPNIMSLPSITPNQGTMPHFSFTLVDADNPQYDPSMAGFKLQCTADPATFNNFDPNTTGARGYTPNLNLVVNTKGAYHIYPTLNIMETVYDRVYLMQVIHGFEQVP